MRLLASRRPKAVVKSGVAPQPYRELAVFADLAVHGDAAAMLLRDDVVGDRQAEAGALAGRLGSEERLEQLVPNVGWYAGAIVSHTDLHRLPGVACGDLQRRHDPGLPAVTRPPRDRV